MNFESEYLQSNHEISVILPDKPRSLTPAQFTAAGRNIQSSGCFTAPLATTATGSAKSNVELYACERDVIVVSVSALNSDYLNWEGFQHRLQYVDYLTEELMPPGL